MNYADAILEAAPEPSGSTQFNNLFTAYNSKDDGITQLAAENCIIQVVGQPNLGFSDAIRLLASGV